MLNKKTCTRESTRMSRKLLTVRTGPLEASALGSETCDTNGEGNVSQQRE